MWSQSSAGVRRSVALAAVIGFIVVAAVACTSDDNWDEAGPDPTLPPPPEADVAYGPSTGCGPVDEDCGGSQEVDIYRSERRGPRPVLVYLHGGGFVEGDKVGSISAYLDVFLRDGWDIVSANYRLTTPDGSNAFPAAVNDVKRLVRWVKANADEQDWDPSNVAAMGHSAGGNLAGMLAVTTDEPELEAAGLPADLAAQDSSVIAAVALNPMFDITLFGANPDWTEAMELYAGCVENCTEEFQQGSVQTHVDPSSIPMLAMHGAKDVLAAPVQGVLVGNEYNRNGIGDRFDIIVVEDGPEQYFGHAIDYERFSQDFLDYLNQFRS